jgi:hypothetical protein
LGCNDAILYVKRISDTIHAMVGEDLLFPTSCGDGWTPII